MPYALIRPDGSVRATSDSPFDLSMFDGHSQYHLEGLRHGLSMESFSIDPLKKTATAIYRIEDLRSKQISEDKAYASSLLAPTDWYAIRKADVGTPVPERIARLRMSIRETQKAREAWMQSSARTVADLLSLTGAPEWPTLENA